MATKANRGEVGQGVCVARVEESHASAGFGWIRARLGRLARCACPLAVVVATLCLVIATSANLGGCSGGDNAASSSQARSGPRRVFASHPVLANIARTLALDAVEVVEPASISTGTELGDPAYWRPTGDEIRAVQACDLILMNGAGYERWAEQAALPSSRVVDTTRSMRAKLIEEAGETHSHGPEGEHAHAGTAFTTWLSSEFARAQAKAVADALVRSGAVTSDAVAPRLASVERGLDEYAATLAEVRTAQPKWLASHPVYQYLAQDAGLSIDSLHWEPGAMPAETEWTKFRLVRLSHPKPTAWMLWEGEPGDEIRARLRAEGVEVVVFAPGGNGQDSAAFPADLVASARAVRDAVRPVAAP
jgi:zinc transport system substrate-binding protein